MATKRRHDDQLVKQMQYRDENSSMQIGQDSQTSMATVPDGQSSINRADLKGVLESSNNNDSTIFNQIQKRKDQNSQYNQTGSQVSHNYNSKITSNIDSIYGFYKRHGAEDENDSNQKSSNFTMNGDNSRNTINCDSTVNMGNYVPANQMLDLRLLNAELNDSQSLQKLNNQKALKQAQQNANSSRVKATGDKNQPIEIFTFKQTPMKKIYQTLNHQTLWNQDPLNRKYNLEMTAEQKYGDKQGFKVTEKKQKRVVGDSVDVKEDMEENKQIDYERIDYPEESAQKNNNSVFNQKHYSGTVGIGKMSEYAQTGIYIDPNQISKKQKSKQKKKGGRDIKFAIKDLEAASMMEMDDFMAGSLPNKRQRIDQDPDEQVDYNIQQNEFNQINQYSIEQQAKMSKSKKKNVQIEDVGMPNFNQNVLNRTNLSLLEFQDFLQAIRIYYPDAKYPIYDLKQIFNMTYKYKPNKILNYSFCQNFQNFLLDYKKEHEDYSFPNMNEEDNGKKYYQARVQAIERRNGVTSLIIKNEQILDIIRGKVNDDNVHKYENGYSKIVLNPIFHSLSVWQGDKIQIDDEVVIVDTCDEYFNEEQIYFYLFPLCIQNMTTQTDIDTNTNMDTNSESGSVFQDGRKLRKNFNNEEKVQQLNRVADLANSMNSESSFSQQKMSLKVQDDKSICDHDTDLDMI